VSPVELPMHRPLWIVLLILSAAAVYADTLVVNNITYKDVRVTDIRDENIYFVVSGNQTHKPLAQVSKLVLDDEPAFNAAEQAYAAREWDKAADGYDKTLRTTPKAWLKDWVSVRLLESASNAGRFDTALKGWIALAEKSPAAARAVNLKMPQADSAYLTEGISLINAALGKARGEEFKELLLDQLANLHNARGDTQAANQVMVKRLEMKAADTSTPEGQRAAALLKLRSAQAALAGKEYDTVIQLVEKNAASLTDPVDQAEAMLLLAHAQAGKAAGSKSADTWKDVALAYMRVVIVAGSSPQAATALLKTAEIHETHLNEKETALRIYQQVAAEFKDQETGKEAQKQVERLR